MATPMNCTTGDVGATFNYTLPSLDGKSLYLAQLPGSPTRFRTNFINDPQNAIVRDLRGLEKDFSLDVNGFEYLIHHTHEAFLGKESIEANYYAEVRQMIKVHTGADRVVIIGHRIR